MTRFVLLISVFLLLFSYLFAAGGTELSFGYQFTKSDAAATMAKDFGIDASNTNEFIIDIHPYAVNHPYFRLGALIGAGFSRNAGTATPELLTVDEASVCFGDARLAFMPEIYRDFNKFNTAFGLAIGGGVIIPFLEDGVGNNDEDITAYFFLRPQITGAYNMGSVAFQIGLGYHIPIAGGDGEFWSQDTQEQKISNAYNPTEMHGFFLKGGFVFGSLSAESGGYGGRGRSGGRRGRR